MISLIIGLSLQNNLILLKHWTSTREVILVSQVFMVVFSLSRRILV
jgi:hypothetical protein